MPPQLGQPFFELFGFFQVIGDHGGCSAFGVRCSAFGLRERVLRVWEGVGKGGDGQSSRKVATHERSAMIRHPALSRLSTPFSREDLFLVVYCVVDDWLHARFGSANAPRARRGPVDGEFSDAEVLTVLLVGELCHCRREHAWLRQVRASYRALFPALPTDGQFSRRAERAQELLRRLRQEILFWADADLEPLRLLDSFPLPLCAC